MQKLLEHNVGSRPFFYPMHLQPVFRKKGFFINEHYPVAENLAEMGFYIPSGLSLTDEQIIMVSDRIHKITQEIK